MKTYMALPLACPDVCPKCGYIVVDRRGLFGKLFKACPTHGKVEPIPLTKYTGRYVDSAGKFRPQG